MNIYSGDTLPAIMRILNAQMAEVSEAQHAASAAEQVLARRQEALSEAYASLLHTPGGASIAAAMRRGEEPKVTLHSDGERLVIEVEGREYRATRRLSELEMRGWLRELGLVE